MRLALIDDDGNTIDVVDVPCPECGHSLEFDDGNDRSDLLHRYVCDKGHAWSAKDLGLDEHF